MLWMGKTILYHGFSLEAALKVRQALTEAGIDYAYRVINNTFGSSRMLSMGNSLWNMRSVYSKGIWSKRGR